MPTTYYLYTTPRHVAQIEEEEKIRIGSTLLGPGIYFTTAGPEDTKPTALEMLKQIHDEEMLPAKEPLMKFTEYFAFSKDQVPAKRKKKGIFHITEMLKLDGVKYTRGQVDHS